MEFISEEMFNNKIPIDLKSNTESSNDGNLKFEIYRDIEIDDNNIGNLTNGFERSLEKTESKFDQAISFYNEAKSLNNDNGNGNGNISTIDVIGVGDGIEETEPSEELNQITQQQDPDSEDSKPRVLIQCLNNIKISVPLDFIEDFNIIFEHEGAILSIENYIEYKGIDESIPDEEYVEIRHLNGTLLVQMKFIKRFAHISKHEGAFLSIQNYIEYVGV